MFSFESDPLDAYDLSDGEGREESSMEVDESIENMPPLSPAVAHSDLCGSTSVGGHGAIAGSSGDRGGGSDSATIEYLSSARGSPANDHEPPVLPLVDVDWNDMENIFQHFLSTERERARRVQEVGISVFEEYMKIHLMTLYPGQPDMSWDYPAFWTRNERHGFTGFCDIIVRGMYLNNWSSFVEQWFIHEDLQSNQPGPCIPWSDD